MNTTQLSILLWVPFLLAALISGVIFSISGYKKGLWRALISLGATIFAALLSMGFAKLLAPAIMPAVVGALPDPGPGSTNLPAGFVMTLFEGLVQNVLALLLFALLMLLLTIAAQIVCNRIKKDRLLARNRSQRFGGLGVGLVTALVFSFLLTLPFYGSLAAYAPAVEQMVSLRAEPQNTPKIYLQANREIRSETAADRLHCITDHPIVRASGSAPVAAVYNGLTRFSANDTSVSFPQMAQTVEAVAAKMDEIRKADEATRPVKRQELMVILREDVVEQEWAYGLAMEFIAAAEAALPEMDEHSTVFFNEIFQSFDVTPAEFRSNGIALLDFTDYALEHDLLTIVKNRDHEQLYASGILQEIGKLVNSSEQAAAKNLLIMAGISDLFRDDPQQVYNFMTEFRVGIITDPAAQLQEAEALLLCVGHSSPAEILMRHPALGEAALRELLTRTDSLAIFGYRGEYGTHLMQMISADSEMQEKIVSKLKECAAQPIGSVSFRAYFQFLMQLESLLREGEFRYDYKVNADCFAFALEVLDAEYFANCAFSAGSELYTVLTRFPAQMRIEEALSWDGYEDDYYPAGIVGLGNLMSAVKDDNLTVDRMGREWLDINISAILVEDTCCAVIKQMLADCGSDPTGIGGNLTQEHAAYLIDFIDTYYEEYTADPRHAAPHDAVVTADELKQFFGLE